MDLICPYKGHTIITFLSSALSTYNDYITVNFEIVYIKTCEYVFLILIMYLNSCLLGAMIPLIFLMADPIYSEGFPFMENDYNDYEGTLDPVNNLYKNNQHDCQYYSVEKFNETFNQDHGLSIIQFNCRSLPQNFDKVKETLNELKTVFDVIALTETWLNTSNMNDYTIEGYESYHSVRENRVGGGVALYIKMDIIVRY